MDCRIPKPREGPLAAPLCSAFAGYCRGAHSRAPVTARHPAALATRGRRWVGDPGQPERRGAPAPGEGRRRIGELHPSPPTTCSAPLSGWARWQ
jgi:hypothetical protein